MLMGSSVQKGMAPTTSKEFKAKLEHKLYLARENPEPIFDLSECDLKQIPQGIFSLCKVFRKEVLLLYSNRLNTLEDGGSINDLKLIHILDLHKNLFVHLTPAISVLTNLRELYLNSNRLKYLPDTICDLYNLQVLNLNDNFLKELPDNFGNLKALQDLSIERNDKLNKLPYTISLCKNLLTIHLDVHRIEEPPKSVVDDGVDCIRKFFADKYNIIYEKDKTDSRICYNKDYSSSINALKDKKFADYIVFEKQNEELLKQELEIREAERLKKEKFLQDLMVQHDRLEFEVRKFQKLKDEDRRKFVDNLIQAELKTDNIVKQLLANRHCESNDEQFKVQEEQLLEIFRTRNNDEIRKKEVLLSMEKMLLQDDIDVFAKRNQQMDSVKNYVKESELKTSDLINLQLYKHDTKRNELMEALLRDEKMQKECLLKLLSKRNDWDMWCLMQRLRLVETQLNDLTKLELEKRKIRNDSALNDLSEMRVELAAHLIELLCERDNRKRRLMQTIQNIEHSCDKFYKEDVWLMRFQQLMDSVPEAFRETNLDVVLMQILLTEGLLSYLPYMGRLMDIVSNDTTIITCKHIEEAGIKDKEIQSSIMYAISIYNDEMKLHLYSKLNESGCEEPSAPPDSPALSRQASTNEIPMHSECVICMDEERQIIFVPCGHLCCCITCSSNNELKLCPMCRIDINQKIRVVVS